MGRSFTDAIMALEKNGHTLEGGYELEVMESCNNEFRASLVAQAKMKHHHKWSSTDIKVGEYKIPADNELNEYQRIVSGVQSVPPQPTLQATETTSSPKTENTSNGEPEAKKAKKSTTTNSDNPYP